MRNLRKEERGEGGKEEVCSWIFSVPITAQRHLGTKGGERGERERERRGRGGRERERKREREGRERGKR